jgi:heme/copper-type cytochrome/quinol oxidase subunit 4
MLRDRLVELESFSPALREQYRKGVDAMLEKRLSTFQRIACSLAGLLGLAFAVGFTIVAIRATSLPPIARGMFAVTALFGLAWAILSFIVVRRGAMNRKSHINISYGLTFGFVLIMMMGYLHLGLSAPDGIKGIKMILAGMVYLITFGIPALLLKHMNDKDLRLREQLLNMELKIAELAERQEAVLAGENGTGPSGDPAVSPRP